MFFSMQYKRLVWGLILALVDIRIGPIDIVPDFAGYILVTMGLSELAEQHHLYGKAKKFSQWLILISIPDIYKTSNGLIHFPGLYMTAVSMFITLVIVIIKLFMVYYICSAIMELSSGNSEGNLFNKAKFRRKMYLYVNGIMMILTPFSVNVGPRLADYLLIPLIIVLIIEILFIGLVNSAGKELGI